VSESEDIGQLLVRALDLLRMHQETLFKNNLATTAAVEALRQTNPAFAAAYDKQFWELKQGRMGEDNATAVRMIDEIKRTLHNAQAQGA
jgi:hypothetical protein